MKQIDQFIIEVSKLEAVEFMGLARLLKVQLLEKDDTAAENVESIKDKYKPRDFHLVFEEVLRNFNGLNRTRKREILKLVKNANKKVKADAGNTKNPEAVE